MRHILINSFNDSELRDLCFDLSIDYESLPDQGKGNKARELIAYVQRHGRTTELVTLCERLRPLADWQTVNKTTPFEGFHARNDREQVDSKTPRGSRDKLLVEFKLASNSHLKRKLERQVEIGEEANETDKPLKVIVYFSVEEYEKVQRILRELQVTGHPDIYLIDARADNKPSTSTV